jgi:hypothetical protein
MRNVNVSHKDEIKGYLKEIIQNKDYDDLVTVFEIGKEPNNSDIRKTILDALKKKGNFILLNTCIY